jgi:glycopeptide antibiotics resistance protein
LYIPERYTELKHTLLRWPWDEYYPGWTYWKDVLMNIVGFMPLGFFLCAYLSLGLRFGRPGLITILFGFTVSLTVEILQAYLPTRDSGMTDIITNTMGTTLGVLVFRYTGLALGSLERSRYATVRYAAALFCD